MIPVMQTLHGKKGNCFQACLASILERNIDSIPDFVGLYPPDTWIERCHNWLLHTHGLCMIIVDPNHYHNELSHVIYIGSGNHPDYPEQYHACIYEGGTLLHDPGNGILGIDVDCIYLFVDPMKRKIKHAE